jgi:hypothetical protein
MTAHARSALWSAVNFRLLITRADERVRAVTAPWRDDPPIACRRVLAQFGDHDVRGDHPERLLPGVESTDLSH